MDTFDVRNRGMSLVELLVAVAVLGIAMIGILALINLSTRYYSNSSKEVEVQSELQTTFALVSNMIVDANKGVVLRSSGTSTATYRISNKQTVYVVRWKGKNLYARAFSVANVATDPPVDNIANDANLLADHVESFSIDVGHYDDGYVSMSMEVKYGSREASMTKNVFLRNSEIDAGSFFSECTIEKTDKKAEFAITRAEGVDTIDVNTPITIRLKLTLGAYSLGTVSGDILENIVTHYNSVTGVLTIHANTNTSWAAEGTLTVSVKKATAAGTESDIEDEHVAVVGISK